MCNRCTKIYMCICAYVVMYYDISYVPYHMQYYYRFLTSAVDAIIVHLWNPVLLVEQQERRLACKNILQQCRDILLFGSGLIWMNSRNVGCLNRK